MKPIEDAADMVHLTTAQAGAVRDYSAAALEQGDALFGRLCEDGLAPEVAANVIAQVLMRAGCVLACAAAREIGGREPSRERWMHAASLAWDAVNPPAPEATP